MHRIIPHFWLDFALSLPGNQENQTFEILKKIPGDIIILHMYHKWQSYDAWFWDVEHNRQNFLSFWTIFCPFTPLTTQKLKFLKKWKRPWRYYHFIHVHNKWQSNDLWFLRCGLQWTEIFVIWEHLWHFYPPKNWKIKHLKKLKKNARRYYHFIHAYHTWKSYDVWFLIYGAHRT